MEVDVLRSTHRPERLVCQAARGDYYGGYVGDTQYVELMDSVNWDEQHMDRAKEMKDYDFPTNDQYWESEAATLAFIEKQLSRGHFGVWEHPSITFAVKGVSRVTMAQITRHRHMTFDVQSMRYADFAEKDAIVPASLLSRDERVERYPHTYDDDGDHFSRESGLLDLSEARREEFRRKYENYVETQFELYHAMTEYDIPNEDARFLLPLGTPVNMTFSGNARTFMHVFNLRQKANSQWEIRELSNRLANELEDWMPYTGQWWEANGPMKISP